MIGKQVLRVNLRNKIPSVKLTYRKRLELLVIHEMHIQFFFFFLFPMQIKFDLKKMKKIILEGGGWGGWSGVDLENSF